AKPWRRLSKSDLNLTLVSQHRKTCLRAPSNKYRVQAGPAKPISIYRVAAAAAAAGRDVFKAKKQPSKQFPNMETRSKQNTTACTDCYDGVRTSNSTPNRC
ncbi:unnamed protein product, partial [Ectocarpus sp. 8 AP-2014]